MLKPIYSYSVLVVSSTNRFNEAINKFLTGSPIDDITYTSDINMASRLLLEKHFDFMIVNSPVNGDMALKFICDKGYGPGPTTLVYIPSQSPNETVDMLVDHGIFVINKPASETIMAASINWLIAANNRKKSFEKKAVSIETRMEQIRLVNKAKWLLIDHLKMDEQKAHHYIEKQAMNNGVTKAEIARQIIATYNQ